MTTTTADNAPASDRLKRLALTLSAAVLVLLLLLRAGLPTAAPAYAGEMTIKGGDISAMTTDSNGREFLFIVDDRTEMMMIYALARDGLILRDSQNLADVFTAARGQSGSGRGIQR